RLGGANLVFAQWRAVRRRGALLVGSTDRDRSFGDDERRLRGALRAPERLVQLGAVVAVDVLSRPAVSGETRCYVFAERELGLAVDGDLVVIVEHDQIVEAEVAGEARGLGAHALHQVAVGSEDVNAIVDEWRAAVHASSS